MNADRPLIFSSAAFVASMLCVTGCGRKEPPRYENAQPKLVVEYGGRKIPILSGINHGRGERRILRFSNEKLACDDHLKNDRLIIEVPVSVGRDGKTTVERAWIREPTEDGSTHRVETHVLDVKVKTISMHMDPPARETDFYAAKRLWGQIDLEIDHPSRPSISIVGELDTIGCGFGTL